MIDRNDAMMLLHAVPRGNVNDVALIRQRRNIKGHKFHVQQFGAGQKISI